MPRIKKEVPHIERPKRVTLQDIAKIAGVQKMTVSDALNGTRSVAPATRERIQQIAKDLNYIPNFAARALSTGRTGLIAILSGPMNEAYYASMVHELEKHISADEFHLVLMRTPREVKELIDATGKVAVDGAIAIDMMGLVNEFRSHPTVPCVSIGTFEYSFVDYVAVDLSAAVKEAISVMISSGRRRVAYLVTATHLAKETEVRAGAYLATMQAAKRTPEIINVYTDDLDAVEEKFKAYIDENGCPDALFCQNDQTAMCAFRALKDSGFKVPDDVLLVGCDGQPSMRYFDPPLSTIVQPVEEMCEIAWEFLKQRMALPNLPHQTALLQGSLVVRESVLPPSHSNSKKLKKNRKS